MENLLTNFMYFSSINDISSSILNTIYENNPKLYRLNLSKVFDLKLRKFMSETVNIEYDVPYDQDEVYDALTFFADGFHAYRSDVSFLTNRDITDDQICHFKLGDISGFLDHLNDNSYLLDDYNRYLARDILSYFMFVVNEMDKKFGNSSIVTIPSYSVDGLCTGIVGRVVGYVKANGIRNKYKFINSNPSTYLLGENNFDKYDWFYLVEGVFDLMALDRVGVKNVLTVSATSLSDEHVDKLKHKKLVALFDNDRGGFFGIRRLTGQSLNLLNTLIFPGSKDIDEADSDELLNFLNCHQPVF